jgi:phosphoribosylformylglycinamidine synthase
MILFFKNSESLWYAVDSKEQFNQTDIDKLTWLFSGAEQQKGESFDGYFVGPRREMITPWSTNAVEITQNMGLTGILRIEEFQQVENDKVKYDPMLRKFYNAIDQSVFTINKQPDAILYIDDVAAYNKKEGLALNDDEIGYLDGLSKKLNRKLTDSEIFGFSQVNSEHCRHKIFNGTFIIDGVEKPDSLFQLIKQTTKMHPNRVVSAYKDNCAFMQGPTVEQFAPATQDKPDYFGVKDREAVFSLKAETHNFPTTVEPFNGAATGTGGEIRDRMAGGKASFPIAGTAVYMVSYPRLDGGRSWEGLFPERNWLYQTPEDILIKASNGASDFGNKFGQPLICGSVLTFEHKENNKTQGFDKVIMQAGGIGYGWKVDSLKDEPSVGDKVVLLGGDNYRIGMGGGAVSSVATGEYANNIELNAVQRSNPEMQKRAYNAIRALGEMDHNPIISIHDHGAGGHLNCLSELVEATGGIINIDKLPVGDPTLSSKEIVGNESQERMGMVVHAKDVELITNIANRERSPINIIGETTGDHKFTFINHNNGEVPIDLTLDDMFGNPPKTIMRDETQLVNYAEITYSQDAIEEYIESILQIESVACKDYLTNKVDRSVTGKIAKQQCCGELQLPLNNCGVVAFDYKNNTGIATSIGHAPVSGLVDPSHGSILAISEALTNIVFAPIEGGIAGISLSANWMWPCKNKGEDARLYKAVEATSQFAIALGINIPTGKDSLSMTQKYKNGEVVYAPGTVIISGSGEVTDIRKVVEPVLKPIADSSLIYIDLSKTALCLGGSTFGQIVNKLGTETPTVADASYFAKAFDAIQALIEKGLVIAGHDISAGGLITTLLEMNFANTKGGISISLDGFAETDLVKILFNENPAIVLQVGKEAKTELSKQGISFIEIGTIAEGRTATISKAGKTLSLDINKLRDIWYKTSFLLDSVQSGKTKAAERFANYKNVALSYNFPTTFDGKLSTFGLDKNRRTKSGVRAAIIREKGVNGDREMAWSMHLAGFDVKDVHMTDLISGRETLEDINFIVFVGGFSNSDVLGSAKGWAGAFLYNEKAKQALLNFYARKDTMSLGVCNGCQLVVELNSVLNIMGLKHETSPKMLHNESHKFESNFISVAVQQSTSIMLNSLAGSKLGIWIAHGEGKFLLPEAEANYNIALKYAYAQYPANPNGSDYNVAGICSEDGRHLAMMPHLERAIYPWNWAHYPDARKQDEVTPWIEAFVNAKKWIEKMC